MNWSAFPFLFLSHLSKSVCSWVFSLLDGSINHNGFPVGDSRLSPGTGCLNTAHVQDWGPSGDPNFCFRVFYDCTFHHQMEFFKALILIVLKDEMYGLKVKAANLIKWALISPHSHNWPNPHDPYKEWIAVGRRGLNSLHIIKIHNELHILSPSPVTC